MDSIHELAVNEMRQAFLKAAWAGLDERRWRVIVPSNANCLRLPQPRLKSRAACSINPLTRRPTGVIRREEGYDISDIVGVTKT